MLKGLKKIYSILILTLLFCNTEALAQLPANCTSNVPFDTLDLSADPGMTITSDWFVRRETCCSDAARCILFVVYLHPDAEGITFNIPGGGECGAVPPGGIGYRVNCGPEIPGGGNVCISGVGPHYITVCKPGNNSNCYRISSIPKPTAPEAISVNDGCTGTMTTSGFNLSSIRWNSISPGAIGAHNNLLSCTAGCATTIATGQVGSPTEVQYRVCGVPAGGCNTDTVCFVTTVTFNPTLFVNILPENPTVCFGQTNTTLTANGVGGTPPYTYLWSNGATTQSVNVGVGTYNVILGDNSTCPPTSATITVTDFTSQILANAGPDQTVCRQFPTATLNGSVQAATGGIWMGGNGTFLPDRTTLNATYTPSDAELASNSVTFYLLTTGNGSCPPDSDYVTIFYQDFQGTLTTTPTNITCRGADNGIATANITGAGTPYTFSWNTVPAQTSQTISNLTPGTYTVTVTDNIGCTNTATATITQPDTLSVVPTANNVTCFDGGNGSVTVNATGGTAPYNYFWLHNSSTSNVLSGVSAGTYTVRITDANNCIIERVFEITEPTILIAIATVVSNVSCFGGSDGSATVEVTGGTGDYTYSWSPSGGTAPTATGLSAGSYLVTVLDDNGCQANAAEIIIQPSAPLDVAITPQNVACEGGSTGGATAAGFGGTPPYTYTWSTGETTDVVSDLAVGTYWVRVRDGNGCEQTRFLTIAEPALLEVFENFVDSVSCFGGSDGAISVYVTGGTPGYTYIWDNGLSNTANPTNLSEGIYNLTVRDANNCEAEITVTVFQPDIPIDITHVQTDVSCKDGSNGSASLTVTGGNPGYFYVWTPSVSVGATATNIPADTYRVVVTDSKGCPDSIFITINEPDSLLLEMSKTDVSCNAGSDGTATVVPTGGTPDFSYSWFPTGGTNSTATGLVTGTYSVTVTDNNGCITTESILVDYPDYLSATITITDVLCNGDNTGSATAITSGGTAPYSFTWLPATGTDDNINGVPAGIYTLVVTDVNGCIYEEEFEIDQPEPLLFTTQMDSVRCFGESNGVASVYAYGGAGNYTYLWSSGGTTATESGLAMGTYTVTITDDNGCTTDTSIAVEEPLLLEVNISSTDVICRGASDGTATALPTGGNGNYTYSWLPGGATAATITGLIIGNYDITVTDFKGCTATNSILIEEPIDDLTVTFNVTDVSCFGGSDGELTANPSGGRAPYQYLWTHSGETTATSSNLSINTYNVRVTDSTGCSIVEFVEVDQPSDLILSPGLVESVRCFGGSDGSVSVQASGGVAPYTYEWNPGGETSAVIDNIIAGTYNVEVTDANGCIKDIEIIVDEPTAALDGTFNINNIICHGDSTGSAEFLATGGTAPYTYFWLPTSQTTSTASNLWAGVFTVYVEDANGCNYEAQATIIQNDAIDIAFTIDPSTCGDPNGAVSVAVSGGNSPYSFSWTNGTGTFNSTDQDISSVLAQNYILTVTDDLGCDQVAFASVNNIGGPIIEIYDIEDVTCFGGSNGSATVRVINFVPGSPYTYSWDTDPVQGATSSFNTHTATGLSIGVYLATVIDSVGCPAYAYTLPEVRQPPRIEAQIVPTHVLCKGASTGRARVTPFGGTPATGLHPYTYSWNTTPVQTDSIATNLSAGTYTVTVTDANNCSEDFSITITEPDTIIATASVVSNVRCYGEDDGSVTVSATGGVPGAGGVYNYLWTPGNATSQTVNGLIAGTYTVTVTDANGCAVASNAAIITEPLAPLSATTGSTQPTCFGNSDGGATITPAGGTTPYNYVWTHGPAGTGADHSINAAAGEYTVTVTDDNGCILTRSITITQPTLVTASISTSTDVLCRGLATGIASVGASGGIPGYTYEWTSTNPILNNDNSTISGLLAGSYSVTVRDSRNCPANANVTINEPATIVTVDYQSHSDVTCFEFDNGSLTFLASGGVGGYTYSWSPAVSATNSANNLIADNYTINVLDANGCPASTNFTINQPTQLVITNLSKTDVRCNAESNGSVSVTASGGTPNYDYTWTPGPSNAQNYNNLSSGTYAVTIRDANLCSVSGTITVDQPTVLAATVAQTNVSCHGFNDGTATVTASGGNGGYLYTWTPTAQTNATATGLSAGQYTATINDALGCQIERLFTITHPNPLDLAIVSDGVICFGESNGWAVAYVAGGTQLYTYSWDSGSSDSIANNLAANTYTINVTDANNCQISDVVIIGQPDILAGVLSATDVNCFEGSDGTVNVVVSGGNGNYIFSWDPSEGNGPDVVSLPEGTYTVTITDQKGCVFIDAIDIDQPQAPLAISSNVTHLLCYNTPIGEIELNTAGGTPTYNYSWSHDTGLNSDVASGLSADEYLVTIFDNNGCRFDTAFVITEPTELLAVVSNIDAEYCSLINGAAHAFVSGGTEAYSFLWTPGGLDSTSIVGVQADNYTLVVTDNNGCISTVNFEIPFEISAFATIIDFQNVSCFNGNDGSMSVEVTNGYEPYVYSWSPSGNTDSAATELYVGVHIVTIVDSRGCEFSAQDTLSQPDPLEALIASAFDLRCNSNPEGYAVATATGGTSPYSYLWNSGHASDSATDLWAGTYIATVTDLNGCMDSIEVTISEPEQLLIVSVTGTDPRCFGGTDGAVFAVAEGGTPPYNYSWEDELGNQISSDQQPSTLSAGTYKVEITDVNLCFVFDEVTLNQPTQVVTTGSGDQEICLGASTNVFASATGGTEEFYYVWSPNISSISDTINVSPTTNSFYVVTAYDSKGCPGNRDTIRVRILDLRPDSVWINSRDAICPGGNAQISVTIPNNDPYISFQWDEPQIGNVPDIIYSVPVSEPTVFNITVTHTVCGFSLQDSIPIIFKDLPDINAESISYAGCDPLTVVFDDVVIDSEFDVTEWWWDFGDGTTTFGAEPVHTFNYRPNPYVVTLRVSVDECEVVSSSANLNVTVYPRPDADFVFNPEKSFIPDPVFFADKSSPSVIRHDWDFGDGTTSSQRNPRHHYTEVGEYTITLIVEDFNGCLDTVIKEILVTSNIRVPTAFIPDPNGPNGGRYNRNMMDNSIFFPYAEGVEEFHMLIFNRWGELIFESKEFEIGWDGYYRGQLCKSDVYVWKIRARFNDDRIWEKAGDITLLR
jgi:large repetitive protein